MVMNDAMMSTVGKIMKGAVAKRRTRSKKKVKKESPKATEKKNQAYGE